MYVFSPERGASSTSDQLSPTRFEESFEYSAETPEPSPGYEHFTGFGLGVEHVNLAEFAEANSLSEALLQTIASHQNRQVVQNDVLMAGQLQLQQHLERQEQRDEDRHNEVRGFWRQTDANLSKIAHKLNDQKAQLAAVSLKSTRAAEANEKATQAFDAKFHAMNAGQQAMMKTVCAVLATLPPLPTPASQ